MSNPDDPVQQLAEQLFEKIRPTMERDKPPGCGVGKLACVEALAELLRQQTPPEKLFDRFAAQVRDKPERFFTGIGQLLDERAGQVFAQIAEALKAALPGGMTLKRTECVAAIRALMEKGTEPSKLMEAFMAEVQSNLPKYVAMPAGASPFRSRGPTGMGSSSPISPSASSGAEAKRPW
jgi:hypothetical protein